ncbi:MAG TPA: hypothetical protein VK752_09230 [Bryobacteraceae bacterium]|jgi:hypothetical protein|nr:hypothetical protein [Bryobacteraceae bacterium]
MEHVDYFVEFGAALIGLICLPILAMMLVRGHKIPECFSCGAKKVRSSRPVGFWDTCGYAFMIRPFRCGGCRERFHAFFLFGPSPAAPPAPPRRVVKVAFRFRNGLPNRIAIRVIDPTREAANQKPDPISGNPAILQI